MYIFYKSRISLAIITATIIAALSACTGNPIIPDYDAATNFNKYSSYSWKSEMPDKTTHVKNPFLHTAILRDIELILKERKLDKSKKGVVADLVIDYQVSVETKRASSNSSISFGTGSYGRSSSVGIGVAVPLGGASYEYNVTFIISMTDRKKNKIVWRAVGTESISDKPASTNYKNRLREMAKEIISTYPPGNK